MGKGNVFVCLSACLCLSQGQGHFEIKVIPELKCKYLDFYDKAGGEPSTKFILV